MALGDSYATLTELRSRLGISDAQDDDRLTNALKSASLGINRECKRQFNDSGTTSTRVYKPLSSGWVDVDDFSTTTGLVIKSDDTNSGSYTTTWTSSDYELYPLNGIQDGEPGFPYWQIRSTGNRQFNNCNARTSVQVTARWGWSAVPAVIKEATLIVAAEVFKLKDAPFGVAGFGDYGAVRVRQNPMVTAMIRPYASELILVG